MQTKYLCVLIHIWIKGEVDLSPPVKYFTDRSKSLLLWWIFFMFFFSILCLLCLCAPLFKCALWSPAGRGLASWLSFVVSHCEFVASPLVSWVRCGTWLYRFLIVAPLLTFITSRHGCLTLIAIFLTNVCLSEFLCIFLTAHRHYLQYVILVISGFQRYG